MAFDHFIYAKQSAFGTWATPTRAIPVTSADIQSQREVKSFETTGSGRGPYGHVLGAKPVSLALELPFWTVNMATLFNQLLTTLATTNPTTGVYDQALLFDDTAALGSVSGQCKYKSDLARNVLGATVNSATISAVAKEMVNLSFDFACKDEALAGGVWDYDGATSSAAVVALPSYATQRRPLMFYDATVISGGTAALSSSKLSVSGGTTYTKLNSLEIAINTNLDTDGFGLSTDPTQQELFPGNREITASFEMSWTDYATTFYTAARNGSPLALDLTLAGPVITGAYKYEAHVCIPSLFFDPVNLPPLSGDKSRRKITVTGRAQTDTTTGVDFGMWLRTGEATI